MKTLKRLLLAFFKGYPFYGVSKCGWENCPNCKSKTKDAHYKFIKIKNAPNSDNFFSKRKSN